MIIIMSSKKRLKEKKPKEGKFQTLTEEVKSKYEEHDREKKSEINTLNEILYIFNIFSKV